VVITVRGETELVARAGHLFATVKDEFVCAARDLNTWGQPEAREAVNRRVSAVGHAAFSVRKLLTPAALADEDGRRHLRQIIARGAQVRISASPLPCETIVIDRSFAILAEAVPASGGPREYTVTNTPSVVGGVWSLLEAAWQAATGFDDYLRSDRPQLDAGGRAVLRMLGDGHTDESAARQLGLSLRTYRRRVAELLAVLDAGSRFQAGVRAGELGLTG
jgi:DNA-binding NarL/FixJ family response regulator